MTSAGVDNAHCSVCGEEIGTMKSVLAPNGRKVCEVCVENARHVLASRELRKHRRAAEAKTQAELASVENDNRIVLELQEDEWLRATAQNCPNCARFMPLADEACKHCGYGSLSGSPKKSKSKRRFRVPRGGGQIVRASTGPVDDVLTDVHPNLPIIVPLLALSPAIIGLALAWRVPWLWNTAIMTLLAVGACTIACCSILLVQSKSRQLLAWCACVVVLVAGAAVILRDINLGWTAATAAIQGLTLATMWLISHRDRLDLSLRITLGLLGIGAAVVASYLASRLS